MRGDEQVEPEGLDPDEPLAHDDDPAKEQPTQPQRPRIPAPDPAARESGKSFMKADEPALAKADEAPLSVTMAEGEVTKTSAPPSLTFEIGKQVSQLIKTMRNGVVPPFLGAHATASMTLMFGDPQPEGPQQELHTSATEAQAAVIAEIIDLEGDELFESAFQVGPPMQHYIELLRLIENNGIRLTWAARNHTPRELSPAKAHKQHERLTEPPEMRERAMTVQGTLYRVQTETSNEEFEGAVGIVLHKDSAVPPGTKTPKRYPILYADPGLEGKIKNGLVGEYVEADLVIREPVHGTVITPEPIHPILVDIRRWDRPEPSPLPFADPA